MYKVLTQLFERSSVTALEEPSRTGYRSFLLSTVTVSMLFLALCVLGMIAWARIPLEPFPLPFQGLHCGFVLFPDSQPRESEEKVLAHRRTHLRY